LFEEDAIELVEVLLADFEYAAAAVNFFRGVLETPKE
jgi:hypothetical protein